MKRILLVVLIAILILSYFVNWYVTEQQKKLDEENILESLEKDFYFCKIIKREDKDIWLICNGRPFYAIYDNGELNYELNGWSFLKNDVIVWNDLDNCDFYTYKDSELIFYCPKDFDSKNMVAKIYKFDDEINIEKIREENFFDILVNDIEKVYPFLSSCEFKDFNSFKSENYPPVLEIYFDCSEGDYVIYTDLATVPLQPPILLNSDLPYEEKSKMSFEKSFNLPIEYIDSLNNQTTITSKNFNVRYFFSENTCGLAYKINKIYDEEDAEMAIREFGKYFIFPPIEKINTIEFIGEISDDVLSFKINDVDIVSVNHIKTLNLINSFWKKTEGIYR